MKRKLFSVAAAFVCLSLAPHVVLPLAEAQEAYTKQRTISTDGEARIWIEPDRARVYLGIETMGETVALARDDNASKMSTVMAALKRLKIGGMLIKAPSYDVSLVKEPEYDATRAGRLPKIIGYKVTQEFTVLLQSKDMVVLSKDGGRVVDTALNSGVNIIQKVQFFKEDDTQDRREAMRLAVKDAISNARAMAEAAGVSIKDYTTVSSSMHYWRPPMMTQMRQALAPAEEAGVPTTLVAGRIGVTCNVHLSCTIE